MTRVDFREWLLAHNCKFEALKEATTGNAIKVINPKFDGVHAFLNLPIDDRPAKCFMVCTICRKLSIDVPDECKHCIGLDDHIRDTHYPDR